MDRGPRTEDQVTTGGDVADSIIITGDHNVVQVVHQARDEAARRGHDLRRMLRVLVLLAAPVVGAEPGDPPPPRLNLPGEWRRLAEAVRQSQAPIALIRLMPPTLEALRFALSPRALEQELAPHILHFAGHGGPDYLLFEDPWGRADRVPTEALLALGRDLPAPLALAVFNGCRTADGADAAARAAVEGGLARAALGHQERVADEEAIRFAARLYAELARGGYPLEEALERACADLGLRGPATGREGPEEGPVVVAGRPYRPPRLFGDPTLRLGPLPPGEPLVEDARPPGTLPSNPTPFFGRGEELVSLARALADDDWRVILLTGIAGIGKTALAVEAAHRNGWRFGGGVTWADAPQRPEAAAGLTADDLLSRLAADLRLPGQPGERPADRLLAHCAARPTLLLLDNLEAWAQARPDQLEVLADFLRRLPAPSHALVTLRPPSARLEALPNAWSLPLVEGLDSDAARALVRHVARVKDTAALREGAEALRWAGALADRLHGHPKMLELAVAQAKRRGVKRLLRELETLRGEPERWLATMVGWSVELLGEAGRRVLPYLLLFPAGSCRGEAMEAAVGGEAVAGLDELHDAGLVFYDDGSDRYRWHGSVVDYVAGPGAPALAEEEVAAARVRLLAHYGGWIEEVGWENYRAIATEQENLWPLLEWARAAAEGGDERVCHPYGELAWRLNQYFIVRGYWSEGIRHLEAALGIARAVGDRAREAGLVHHLAVMYQATGDYAQARRLYQESRQIKERLGDQLGWGQTTFMLGWLLWKEMGDAPQAIALWEQVLSVFERYDVEEIMERRGFPVREALEQAKAGRTAEEWLAQVEREMGDRGTGQRMGNE